MSGDVPFETPRLSVLEEAFAGGVPCRAFPPIVIGESDDVKQSLFRILNTQSAAVNQFGPLSFSLELAPAAERRAVQQALISELKPACLTE